MSLRTRAVDLKTPSHLAQEDGLSRRIQINLLCQDGLSQLIGIDLPIAVDIARSEGLEHHRPGRGGGVEKPVHDRTGLPESDDLADERCFLCIPPAEDLELSNLPGGAGIHVAP